MPAAVAILVILGWADGARPEDAPTAPTGTRSLAETPFQLVLPTAHAFGDWYGARTWLEGHGITPSLTLVTDALGNPTGGSRQGFRGASNLGLDLLFDLEKLAGLSGGSFEVSFSAASAPSAPPDSEVVFYCAEPREATSARIALRLAIRLKHVHPLSGGLGAWRQAGFAVEPLIGTSDSRTEQQAPARGTPSRRPDGLGAR